MTQSSPRRIRTTFGGLFDRSVPPIAAAELAKTCEASGVVDEIVFWDQLTSWWPQALWHPDVTPLAAISPDCDSFPDPVVLGSIAGAAVPGMGITVTTDALRRGPAELMQTMLTLASLTEGRATLWLGAGELKQAAPFGYRRAEGIDRLEDILGIFQELWRCEGPIDYDGIVWKLQHAWIGGIRPFQPKVYGMGNGPRFLELLPKYADGWVVAVPPGVPRTEDFAKMVDKLKRDVERAGRDPEAFEICAWGMGLVHEDSEVIERGKRNALLRFNTAIGGRFNPDDWTRDGFDPPFPKGWHYATKILPAEMTRAECDEVANRASPEMVETAHFCGTPKEVAARFDEYVEAGATQVCLLDLLAATLPPEDAVNSTGRVLETYGQLRGAPVAANGQR